MLLGSAAVLTSVPAARAADAMIVEPEPVEYVRVCDAYGNGWFYIAGTGTCLKFDGDVRVDYSSLRYHDSDAQLSDHDARYRARLNVRANNETEYGTLSSRIQFVGESSGDHDDLFSGDPGSDPSPGAVISLAGFRVGFADDYWSTAGNYGYYGSIRFDGLYDSSQGLFLDYTYASNGWAATAGVEDTWVSFPPQDPSGTAGQPDVYGGITYSGGGWYLAGVYYYDSSQSSGAWKGRIDYDFGSNGLAVGGWYMADDGDTDYVKGHIWGVTASLDLTESLHLYAGYSDYADQDPAGDPADLSQSTWTVGLQWDVVPGLYIVPEYSGFAFDSLAADGRSNGGVFNLRIVHEF